MICSRKNSIEITPAVGDAAKLRTELLVIGVGGPVTESARHVDELSDGGLSLELESGKLEPAPGATLLIEPLPGVAAARILLVSLGPEAACSEETYRQGLAATADALAENMILDAVVTLVESEVLRRPLSWRVQQAGQILARDPGAGVASGGRIRPMRKIMLLIPQTLTLELVESLRQGVALAEELDPAPSQPIRAARPGPRGDTQSRSSHLPSTAEFNLMSDLVFIAFPTEQKAEEVRQKVLSLQREYLIELGDAVVVVKDEKGQVKLNQMMNLTAAGAASGALWGTLIGFIFLAPLVGTALGAASGALGGKLSDVGINDNFMKEAAGALQPNTAGLFLLIRKMTTDKVLADLKGVGGTLISTSFDETKEAALREALAAHATTEAAAPAAT
jgi:uncharacterized membrane protein